MPKKKSPAIPKALCEGSIEIGGLVLPCYVLDGEIRVLSLRGTSMTFTESPGGGRSLRFLNTSNLRNYVGGDLRNALENPIEFQPKGGGRTAHGIKAEVLPQICEVYIDAERDKMLAEQQKDIAERARILHNGFSYIGIIGLVDEATGYQSVRSNKALAEILEQYLSKEVHQWTKTFPLDFYKQIYRLKRWEWKELENGKKPPTPWIVGKYTDDFIYLRIAPGVLDELRKRDPEMSVRRHQWFNREHGHSALKEHIASVTAVMRVSDTWEQGLINIDRAFPLSWPKGSLFYKGDDDD